MSGYQQNILWYPWYSVILQVDSTRGMGVGGGGWSVKFGTGERASISKPTTFIYLAFEIKDPFIYQIIWNVDPFIYSPLIFCTYLLLVDRQILQSVH